MKHFICLFLALSMLTLTSCGNWDDTVADPMQELSEYYKEENETPEQSPLTSFTLPYYSGETLDPITCSDGCQQIVGALLYEGLYQLDPQFQPQPVLAESAQYDSNTYTYTIQLRSGVCFSDGTAFSAQDAADTLLRAKNSSRYGNRLAEVEQIRCIGTNTLVISLSHPNQSFLSLLDIPIVKSGTEGSLFPLGTGRYLVISEENTIYLTPNTRWWQHRALPLSRIELLGYKSSDAVNYAFAARDIQLLRCDLIGTSSVPTDMSGDYTDANTTTLQYIGFNLRHELLSDPKVRQAISLAIDREGMINTFLLGHGTAAQFPIHPASPLYPAELEKERTSSALDAAMADAGLDAETTLYHLTLLVNEENPFKVAAAQEIAHDLEEYALEITVNVLPWESYEEALRYGNYDLYYGECRMTADWNMAPLIGTAGSLNYGEYSDTVMDARLSTFLDTDSSGLKACATLLCQRFQSEMPIVPICFKSISVLVTSGVVGSITPTAADPFYGLEQWEVQLEIS